jgi:hypothetical protein
MESRTVTSVQVFPYIPGIVCDAEPVVLNASGTYSSARIMHSHMHLLHLEPGCAVSRLQVGASYSWNGVSQSGQSLSSHWLYCTSLGNELTFGTVLNLERRMQAAPLPTQASVEPIKLEALADLTSIERSPNPVFDHVQVQLGSEGWLVMTHMTVPACIGILLPSTALPAGFTVGAARLTIAAKSKRTLQSIVMDELYCAHIGEDVLFLKSVDQC